MTSGDQVIETLLPGLFADRLRDLLLEARVDVDDIPPPRRPVSLGYLRIRRRDVRHPPIPRIARTPIEST